jgi:hypothetical protein
MTHRPQKITVAEMRDMGVRGILVYCADYRCSHSIAVNASAVPYVRPDFNWNRQQVSVMGYR